MSVSSFAVGPLITSFILVQTLSLFCRPLLLFRFASLWYFLYVLGGMAWERGRAFCEAFFFSFHFSFLAYLWWGDLFFLRSPVGLGCACNAIPCYLCLGLLYIGLVWLEMISEGVCLEVCVMGYYAVIRSCVRICGPAGPLSRAG